MVFHSKNFNWAACLALGLGVASLQAAVPAEGSVWNVAAGESETLDAALTLEQLRLNGGLTLETGAALTVTGRVVSAVSVGSGETAGALVIKDGAVYTQVGYDTGDIPGNAYGFSIGTADGVGAVTVEAGGLLEVQNGFLFIGRNGLTTDSADRTWLSQGTLNIFGTVRTPVVECSAWYPSLDGAMYGKYDIEALPVSTIVNLEEGGVLETRNIKRQDAGRAIFNFKGGTLRLMGGNRDDFISSAGSMLWTIAAGKNLIIDTPSHARILRSAVQNNFFTITGAGGLVKKGAGYLQICLPLEADNFSGPIVVEEGILALGRKLVDGQTVYVHKGAQFYACDPDDFAKITYEDPSEAPQPGDVYVVQQRLTDGLDLAAFAPTYATDKLAGPTWGWGGWVIGPVTLAATHGVDNPFTLVGQNSVLDLTDTGLEKVSLNVQGPGRFVFHGPQTNIADRVVNLSAGAGHRVDGDFYVSGAEDRATVTVSGAGTFETGTAHVGFMDGDGTLQITNGVTAKVNGSIRIGGNPTGVRTGVKGTLALDHATLEVTDNVQLGPNSLTDGTDLTTLHNEVVLGPEATLRIGDHITRNDDSRGRFSFRGGHITVMATKTDDYFYSGQNGTLEVVADGADIDINLVTNRIGMISNHTHVFGTGGLRVAGNDPSKNTAIMILGKQGLSDFVVDYAGDTTIENACLRLGTDNVLPYGPGKGVVTGAHGTLELNGHAQSVNNVTGDVLVQGPGTLGVGADDADLTFTAKTRDALLAKDGTGTLTIDSRLDGDLLVRAGTAEFAGAATAYRSYRFKVEGVTTAAANSMQLSELVLLNGQQDVTRPYANLAWETAHDNDRAFPDGERPELLVDGNIATKWLDFRAAPNASAADHDRVWLVINYDEPKAVTGYAWYTANDSTERDPTAWRLQGSNDGGATWTDIDVRTGFSCTTVRRSLAGAFPLAGGLGASALVAVEPGATLRVKGEAALGSVVNNGTVELAPGATLKSNGGALDGAVTGAGGLAVAGGTTTLRGEGSFTGPTHVTGGTLNLGAPAEGMTRTFDGKYFRLTIKRSDGGQDSNKNYSLQASEFQLYNAAGVMQNQGLKAAAVGLDATALAAGTFSSGGVYAYNKAAATDESEVSLFDGNTATKWCCSDRVDGTPANYHVITMRLADSAEPIASYNFFTANDFIRRSPADWMLEGSRDGIFWETLDERYWAPTTTFTVRGDESKDSVKYKPFNLGVNYTFDPVRPQSVAANYLRFTFKKTSASTILQLSELQVFDAAGRNVAKGLVKAADGAAATELAPGSFARGGAYGAGANGGEDMDKLFDDNPDTKLCAVNNNMGGAAGNYRVLTMHLPEGTLPLSGYQFVTANDDLGRSPCDWQVEGSLDGVTWTTLDERAGVARPYCLFTGFNEGHPFAFTSLSAPVASLGTSPLTVDAGTVVNMNDAAAGLAALNVDLTAGAGTINGFRPAPRGTLTLVNKPADVASLPGYELPLTLTDVREAAQLATWKVVVDGTPRADLKVKLNAAGRLSLVSGAMAIFIR